MPLICYISNALSNLVLDIPLDQPPLGLEGLGNTPGTVIQQYKPKGGKNQEWLLRGVGYLPGFQIFSHASPNLVLSVSPSPLAFLFPDSPLWVSLAESAPNYGTGTVDNLPLDQQLWVPLLPSIYDPMGYYLYNRASGLVMEVPSQYPGHEGGKTAKLPIVQHSRHTGANQQWNLLQSPGHSSPRVVVEALIPSPGSIGGQSELTISGTGFTPYEGHAILINFWGIPKPDTRGTALHDLGNGGGTESYIQNGGFTCNYTTPAAQYTATGEQASSQWVSCYVTDVQDQCLVALTSVSLEYFVATSG